MSHQVVRMVLLDRQERFVKAKEAFTFTPERKWHWLQKAALWVLRKLRCEFIDRHQVVTAIQIDTDTLIDRLRQQQVNIVEMFRYRPDKLLIGADDFRELMHTPQINQMMTFRVPDAYRTRDQIFGLTIQVIPWMRGFLVMPKEADRRP